MPRPRPYEHAPRLPEGRVDVRGLVRGEWLERVSHGNGSAPRRTILYFHGGGYYFCSPQSHRALVFQLAARSGARTFSLDYRLAPEHPFPAAHDDALAAYRRLIADGTSPDSIVLAGDSAGGRSSLSCCCSGPASTAFARSVF